MCGLVWIRVHVFGYVCGLVGVRGVLDCVLGSAVRGVRGNCGEYTYKYSTIIQA